MNTNFIADIGNNYSYMKIISLILLFSTLSFSISKAQNPYIDSLYTVLLTVEEDTNKVLLLDEISFACTMFDTNKAIEHAQEILQLSKKLNYTYGIGLAYNKLDISYSLLGDDKLSLEYNDKALKIAEKINNKQLIVWSLENRALTYSLADKNEKAIQLHQQVYDIAIDIRDTSQQIIILGNIISDYEKINNQNQQEFYQKKLFKFIDSYKDPYSLLIIHFEKAKYHKVKNESDSVIYHINKSKDFAITINDNYFISLLSIEIANEYYKIGEESLANDHIQKGISILQTLPPDQSSPELYFNIAKYFYSIEDLVQSKKYALSTLAFSEKVNENDMRLNSYKILSNIYKSKNEFKQALSYAEKHHHLQDSLLTINKITRIKEIEEKYQLEKKEQENELLITKQIKHESIIKNQKKTNIFLLAIASLSFVVGLLIYRLYYIKNENNKSLEQNIKNRTNELSISNQKLKLSNHELERFAYIASHDLKEPLRNISNSVEFLDKTLKNNLDSNQSELMQFLKKNAKLMYQLIEDILEYSKLSNHNIAIEQVDINEVVENIIYSTKNTYKEKSPQILTNNSFPIIPSHKIRMHLLFKNLIENGIKYNESNSPFVKINYESKEAFHLFSITDNGIGIKKDQHENIFEMFKRLHNKYTYEGTGLGLSLSKKIIANHGGEIWVESEVGKGSIFYFTISKTVVPSSDKLQG